MLFVVAEEFKMANGKWQRGYLKKKIKYNIHPLI